MTTAEALRDEAIERADRAADDEWKLAAAEAIRYVAERRAEFTTDAVWYVLERDGVEPPREPRAIAGVLRRVVAEGAIEATGRRVNSTLPRGHARPVMVYRSNLVQAP